jgi:oxygen-independent coproporphyrinogen-3 oxidase
LNTTQLKGTTYISLCKQACHYCDFHFSTDEEEGTWFWLCQRNPNAQKNEFENDTIETIYFGGGTPSVLTSDEINFLIDLGL